MPSSSGPSLPSLPALPPLQMPDPIDSNLSSNTQLNRDQLASSPTQPYSPKHSPSSPGHNIATPLSPLPESSTSRASTSSLAPPQTLRKSISVDSFVKYNSEHPPVPSRNTRNPFRTGASAIKSTIQGLRNRGESLGNANNVHESPYGVDSDTERYDAHSISSERHRHPSLRGQEHLKPTIRGGELPLPARAPVLSTASSVSSVLSSVASSSVGEDNIHLRSSPSVPSIPRRGTIPVMSNEHGRSRSGSLGVYSSTLGKRPVHAAHATHATQVIAMQDLVTIVVVGTPGCGKSVAIRKGSKNFNLSDPVDTPLLQHPSGVKAQCSRRTGRIINELGPDSALEVLEIDIPPVQEPGIVNNLSRVDGVIICYDSSNSMSFRPVESLLRDFLAKMLPTIVLACKSDLEHQVEPEKALEVLQKYDAGLIEVGHTQESGREKRKLSFDWLIQSVFRARLTHEGYAGYRNPASPDLINTSRPWEGSRTATPTGMVAVSPVSAILLAAQPSVLHLSNAEAPSLPASVIPALTRIRSTADLLRDSEPKAKSNSDTNELHPDMYPLHGISSDSLQGVAPLDPPSEEQPRAFRRDLPDLSRWLTLDELLDKLLFLAVSGDDSIFVSHFLLTFRRFATPRNILLAMQKRMRQLDNPSGDPMFACFAQMKICQLLELWIKDYPYDFAVRGTAGALNALVKSIISKTYLLHYGSEFLPFLEMLPTLVDRDTSWAIKLDISDEDEDSYSPWEEEEQMLDIQRTVSNTASDPAPDPPSPVHILTSRERKPSIPVLPKSLLFASGTSGSQSDPADIPPKQLMKDLIKLAQEVMTLDPQEIAEEITRVEVKLFLKIQPRHWLHYTFSSNKKDSEGQPIFEFNAVSNHIADWVVSLILCHDKPKARAKQIEKFVDIAQKLRSLNNYSALRAFVAGVNNATYPGDETMEIFKSRSPDHAKHLQSWDVLLQQMRSHRAYRLALRNTRGACIPALEVHQSDLIKSHEGNSDYHADDLSRIHWAKYTMMGRFIHHIVQFQNQCHSSDQYNYPERKAIAELFVRKPLMSEDLRQARLGLLDADMDDYTQPQNNRDMRRLFFW